MVMSTIFTYGHYRNNLCVLVAVIKSTVIKSRLHVSIKLEPCPIVKNYREIYLSFNDIARFRRGLNFQ